MSSAKAWRYPGVSLGERLRRSSTTRFQRKGERIPPCGHPLLILMVLVESLCIVVDGDMTGRYHVSDPVSCGWV